MSKIRQFFDPLDKISGLINVKEALIISNEERNVFLQTILKKRLQYEHCLTIYHFLKNTIINYDLQDNFVSVRDYDGNETILFRHNTMIFEANCEVIDSIRIPSKIDKCYQDLPVLLKISSKNISGFFDSNLVVIETFTKIDHDQI